MEPRSLAKTVWPLLINVLTVCTYLLEMATGAAAQNVAPKSSEPAILASHGPVSFATPQLAADAVIAAAKNFDVAELVEISVACSRSLAKSPLRTISSPPT